jgi:hypothetical protein
MKYLLHACLVLATATPVFAKELVHFIDDNSKIAALEAEFPNFGKTLSGGWEHVIVSADVTAAQSEFRLPPSPTQREVTRAFVQVIGTGSGEERFLDAIFSHFLARKRQTSRLGVVLIANKLDQDSITEAKWTQTVIEKGAKTSELKFFALVPAKDLGCSNGGTYTGSEFEKLVDYTGGVAIKYCGGDEKSVLAQLAAEVKAWK